MLFGLRLATLVCAALSTGLSFAHLLGKAPRLRWEPELWMGATVFGGQYALFGLVGAILDPLIVLLTALLAWLVRRRGPVFVTTLMGALLFTLALVLWLTMVMPMNEVMAGWTRGSVPADFAAVRAQWENGHGLIAIVKLVAFAALAYSVLLESDGRPARR